MGAKVTDYDWNRNVLYVQSSVMPSAVRIHKADERGRKAYTARVCEYVPKATLEALREKLEEYDSYIQWLCSFVPEDRWDEVYREITTMGIDYIGANDV